MENKIYKLTDKEFIDLVKSSLNTSEVLFKLGYTTKGNSWGYSQVKQRMTDLKLSGLDFRGKSAISTYNEKNKVDREIEEMQLLTKPFIVSKKKANLEKLKEIKEKILLFKTNIKSKFSEKVLTKKLKKI